MVSSYEEQRRLRMLRNQEKLAEIVTSAGAVGKAVEAEKKPKRRRHQQDTNTGRPRRRSLRSANQTAKRKMRAIREVMSDDESDDGSRSDANGSGEDVSTSSGDDSESESVEKSESDECRIASNRSPSRAPRSKAATQTAKRPRKPKAAPRARAAPPRGLNLDDADVAELFHGLDATGRGFISANDLRHVCEELQLEFGAIRKEADVMFELVMSTAASAVQGDGCASAIDFDTFAKFVKSL